MIARDIDDIHSYAARLRGYSAEELEEVYFGIHILRHPLRYKLVRMEMERRNLAPPRVNGPPPQVDIAQWLDSKPFFARFRLLRAMALALLVFAATTAVTFAMLSPIWLFAMPMRFLGIQTAMVYFACAPVPLVLGAGIGGRLGGRGWYSIWALLGVGTAALLFNATGAPSAIIHSILTPKPTGGGGVFGF